MITPVFNITQTHEALEIHIKAPMARVATTEIAIHGAEFVFTSKPYYLRLCLPGELQESGEEARFEADSQSFHIKVLKREPGHHFADLTLLSKLLEPKTSQRKSATKQPLIEVLESSTSDKSLAAKSNSRKVKGDQVPVPSTSGRDSNPTDMDDEDNADMDDDGDEWYIDQVLESESSPSADASLSAPLTPVNHYGFANKRSNCLSRFDAEMLRDVIDLTDADRAGPEERREERLASEDDNFSEEHYLADLFDPQIRAEIDRLIAWDGAWWDKLTLGNESPDIPFTDDERLDIINLPLKKEFLLDRAEIKIAILGLVDLLFVYAYDFRTTEGESTVESSWTVSKLSGTLCWLETYSSLSEVLVCAIRRSLVYPFYRNYELALKCAADVERILRLGPGAVLKALIGIRELFSSDEDDPNANSYYIHNDLYLNDYCVWVQKHLTRSKTNSLADLLHAHLVKSDVTSSAAEQSASESVNRERDNQTLELDSDELSVRLSKALLLRDNAPSTSVGFAPIATSSAKRVVKCETHPLDKSMIGFDLELLERAAQLTIEEESEHGEQL